MAGESPGAAPALGVSPPPPPPPQTTRFISRSPTGMAGYFEPVPIELKGIRLDLRRLSPSCTHEPLPPRQGVPDLYLILHHLTSTAPSVKGYADALMLDWRPVANAPASMFPLRLRDGNPHPHGRLLLRLHHPANRLIRAFAKSASSRLIISRPHALRYAHRFFRMLHHRTAAEGTPVSENRAVSLTPVRHQQTLIDDYNREVQQKARRRRRSYSKTVIASQRSMPKQSPTALVRLLSLRSRMTAKSVPEHHQAVLP